MARSRKKTVIAEGEISNKENSGSSSRCVWTDEDDAILVAVLAKQKQLGNSSDNGFKKSVWATSPKNDPPKVTNKCQDHWGNTLRLQLRKNFLEVQALRNVSGFGWDDGIKTITASDRIWEDYVKCKFLIKGVVATGAGAFHPGQTPPSSPHPESVTSSPPAHHSHATSLLNDELSSSVPISEPF
ncbi:hypothetical protein DFH94DRAFT_684535 [Russula ochroleuca]|uniref:Myb-like domain-containing protein n=1 Tax=Russula ochroleuca TaxID=152965 RepID=A0A9P5MRB7_9AGAM|nr:hypothetical protein DFH94DRAFT_684535 [Russula ochroleuca]